MSKSETSGWVGWIFFASVMMVITGIFQVIIGFITLFNDQYLVITKERLLMFDFTTWAWAHILMGAIIVAAGYAVMNGKVWGRFVGVVMAGISAVANLGFIPAYPIWSIIVIVIDILVIFALTVHGHELRDN